MRSRHFCNDFEEKAAGIPGHLFLVSFIHSIFLQPVEK